ncbi:MAG: hypothetical protein L0Y54_03685 [Sporichthyaceae bacterium]|nr:hypothetical protein [Sporichthyaceae bacterium]
MGLRGALAALVPVAATIGLLAVGCGLPVRGNDGDPLDPRPAIAVSAVSGIVEGYVQVNNAANAERDIKLLRSNEGGSSLAIDAAIYRADRVLDPDDKTKAQPFSYQQEAHFVPRLAGYPRWFAIQARPSYPEANSSLVVFVQPHAGQRWLQSAVIDLGAGNAAPALAKDDHGHVIAVPADDDAGLLAAPAVVAKAQADYLNAGQQATDGLRFSSDAWTNELVQAAATDAKQLPFAKVTNRYAPADEPIYALRTADGGALVVHVMARSFDATLARPGPAWRLAGTFGALAGTNALRSRVLHVEWLYQWLLVVPPAGDGSAEIRVVGRSGGVTKVSGRD